MNIASSLKKIVLIAALSISAISSANNLQITGTSVSGTNITFNVSWDNSWYTNFAPNNWDAVWIFVKYQDCATRLWNHADFSTTVGDHTDALAFMVDGFPDQFGGEKGKKFMSKNLRENLLSISHLPMSEQKINLEETFINWVGSLEQVDDVTIIGIKVI